jgi:hypothetical protein
MFNGVESSVDIATGYKLEGRGIVVRFSTNEIFHFSTESRPALGPRQTSSPMGTKGISLRVIAVGT